jgi:hypothetical protein
VWESSSEHVQNAHLNKCEKGDRETFMLDGRLKAYLDDRSGSRSRGAQAPPKSRANTGVMRFAPSRTAAITLWKIQKELLQKVGGGSWGVVDMAHLTERYPAYTTDPSLGCQ